jgi:hypothetical protein
MAAMIARFAFALLVLVGVTGCSDEAREPAPRGARGAFVPGASAVDVAPAAPPSPRFADDDEGDARFESGDAPRPSAAMPAPASAPQADQPESAPERDFPAELRSKLGDPIACFSNVAALPPRVRMTIEVVVSLSGRVTRAEVAAPGLLEADLECLKQRALALQLDHPVEGAPRRVRTEFEAVYRPAGQPEAEAEREP